MSAIIGQAWRRLGRVGLCVGLGVAGWCAPGLAMSAEAVDATSVPVAEAQKWLLRSRQAAANTNYQGTLMFTAGGVASSSRVAHVCDGRERYERAEQLDGQARLQYRHNDQLTTMWPAAKVARIEQREPAAEFPVLPPEAAQALDNYELRWLGKDRVAGHEAVVAMLKPRDKLRFAQRLWAERGTGLLLRNDLIGPGGEVLESSAFTDLQIGARPMPAEQIVKSMKRLDGYRVVRPQVERARLESEGWTLGRPVPGFQMIGCTKRPLDAPNDAGPPTQVLQSVFTDGLVHVSVFIEPYDAQRHRQPMGTSLGATHTLMNRRGDWWVTVVGEVPLATLQQFETMLERRR